MSMPPPYGPDSSAATPGARRGDDDAAASSASPTHEVGPDEHATRAASSDRAAEPPTAALPVMPDRTSGEDATGTYWQGGPPEPRPRATPASSENEPAIFPEGVYHEPASRAGAHLWAVLITLVLAPVAWFLVNDGTTRIYWSLRADLEALNLAGAASLAGGLVVATIVLLAARWSSVGAAIGGAIGLLVGLAFLVVPGRAFEVLNGWEMSLRQFGGFGENLYSYLEESARGAQFLVAGFILVLVAAVSHGARRKGRREEYARLAVRAARGTNPFA